MDTQILSQLDQIQNAVKDLVAENVKNTQNKNTQNVQNIQSKNTQNVQEVQQQPPITSVYKHTGLDALVGRKVTNKALAAREQVWSKLNAVFGRINMNDAQTKKLQSKLGINSDLTLAKITLGTVKKVKGAGLNIDMKIDGILKVREEE
ncbi:MAG: hypothetical protein FWG63_06400 [Defluviitaleaceae bacterium]|nr:hypothetical protein [Defluviitaleaceae bacterium]